jgi:NADPH:quinone reductase-like Zn-dependent oxidoreductase
MDIIIDFVGAPYLARNVEALAMRGRMVIVGTMGGTEGTVNLGMLMSKRLRIHGTVLRSRPRAEKAELTASFGSKVVPLLAQGVVRPIVDRVFPLHEIAAAHAYMESNASVGKIVLQMA